MAAFILQVIPSIWTAYRTTHPTGVSRGTWLLILGELSCWTIFGQFKSDPRLITLGITGVAASALMLARIRRANEQAGSRVPFPPSGHDVPAVTVSGRDVLAKSAASARPFFKARA